MRLVVGLGNPGPDYALTRHNIGFMAVDALAGPERFTSRFHGEITSRSIEGEKLIFLKPMTFMNNSGRAVHAAMAFYKIAPEDVIVLHDELDLPLGKTRIKQGGGANGHNGIRDIDQYIGPGYWRIRLGIGHPGMKEQVHSHVLSRFSTEELHEVKKINAAITQYFPLFWQHSPAQLASKIAAQLASPKAKKPTPTDDVKLSQE